MSDPFGKAIFDYYLKNKAANILVSSNYTEDESIPVSYFFRSEEEMPSVEKEALKLCYGEILDVGAAAGCHSIILQKNGLKITALEKSPLAAEILKKRGLKNVICEDIFNYEGDNFDTILLLMNGAGIGKTIKGLKKLLKHLKKLLSTQGQILIDSSDIHYLFEEEDGSVWVDLSSGKYYGEMMYEVKYKKEVDNFQWLFIDFESLSKVACEAGFSIILMKEGDHFDYLAQLKPI